MPKTLSKIPKLTPMGFAALYLTYGLYNFSYKIDLPVATL